MATKKEIKEAELRGEKRAQDRFLAVLEMAKPLIGENHFIWIYNRVVGGLDPRDPDYLDDRLTP